MYQEGWFPDPSGRPNTLRYYDGTAWTDHVTTTTPPKPPGNPWKVATWILAALLTLTLALAGVLGGLLVANGEGGIAIPSTELACTDAPASGRVHGDGYVELPIIKDWPLSSDASYAPYWMECGSLADYWGRSGFGFLAVGRLGAGYPDDLAAIAEDVLEEELEAGGLTLRGATEAAPTTVDGRPAWRVDTVGYESAGAQRAEWGSLLRVLVIEHEGERPSVVAVQVSGSDAEARAKIDAVLAGIHLR